MKKIVRFIALLLVLSSTLPMFAGKKATIKVINQSKWEIHHVYLSPSGDSQWGEDYLGEDVLSKGDSLTLTDIECDEYDIKVVDEDGDECIIEKVELCGGEAYWKITDKMLLSCEGYN